MPRGGKREGAGRPRGARNVLGYGEKQAIASLVRTEKFLNEVPKDIRTAKDVPAEHRALADHALRRIVDVLDEKVHPSMAPSVLKAATVVREEIVGPIQQKVKVEGSFSRAVEASLLPEGES